MKIIDLDAARARLGLPLPSRWRPHETAELMRLYIAARGHGGAVGYAYGETENRDPQLYFLGADPARPCITCVSRLEKRSRCWYVIEDGFGVPLVEGSGLRTLVSRIRGYWRAMRHNLQIAPIILLGQLFADDASIGDGVAAGIGCLLAVA